MWVKEDADRVSWKRNWINKRQKPLQIQEVPQKQTFGDRENLGQYSFLLVYSASGDSWREDSRLGSLLVWLFLYINKLLYKKIKVNINSDHTTIVHVSVFAHITSLIALQKIQLPLCAFIIICNWFKSICARLQRHATFSHMTTIKIKPLHKQKSAYRT